MAVRGLRAPEVDPIGLRRGGRGGRLRCRRSPGTTGGSGRSQDRRRLARLEREPEAVGQCRQRGAAADASRRPRPGCRGFLCQNVRGIVHQSSQREHRLGRDSDGAEEVEEELGREGLAGSRASPSAAAAEAAAASERRRRIDLAFRRQQPLRGPRDRALQPPQNSSKQPQVPGHRPIIRWSISRIRRRGTHRRRWRRRGPLPSPFCPASSDSSSASTTSKTSFALGPPLRRVRGQSSLVDRSGESRGSQVERRRVCCSAFQVVGLVKDHHRPLPRKLPEPCPRPGVDQIIVGNEDDVCRRCKPSRDVKRAGATPTPAAAVSRQLVKLLQTQTHARCPGVVPEEAVDARVPPAGA